MKMYRLYILLFLFTSLNSYSSPDSKNKDIGSSPFKWFVSVDNKQYSNSDINKIKNGFKIDNGKVSCQFEFNTEWDTDSGFAKKYGSTYDERLWLQCTINGTKIHPNAVGCSKSKNSQSDSDSLSITIGKSHLIIRCSS
jgi:hypothetical protein